MKFALDSAYTGQLTLGDRQYAYADLKRLFDADTLARLPYSLRLLVENVARCFPEALPPVLARARHARRPSCPTA